MRAVDIAELIAATPALGERLSEGRPEVLGLVDWAVQRELAATVSDVMIRRTQLFYRARDQGLSAAVRVAARMGELLGWDDAQREVELARYRADVAVSRSYRAGDDSAPEPRASSETISA